MELFEKSSLEDTGIGYEKLQERAVFVRHLATEVEEFLVPTGGMLKFPPPAEGPDTIPTKFLRCDGSQVNRRTLRSLFGAIGTRHGVGDGSTTFNLPNDTDFIIRT